MANDAKYKQQLASLGSASSGGKVTILQEFQTAFSEESYSNPDTVKDIFQKSNLLALLSNLLEENKGTWATAWPEWLDDLISSLSDYSAVQGLFPTEQIHTLSNTFKKNVLSGTLPVLRAYSLFACFDEVKNLLVQDAELYNLKNSKVLQFFYNVSSDVAWQKKLLADKQFILDLLALPESEDVWDLFVNLAHHPDAKERLPKEVLEKASKSSYIRCTDLCALLCNDNDLVNLKLNDEWIDHTANLLKTLLSDGQVKANGISYDLLDLILPIANFSTVYAKQEALGKRVIPLLLKVATEELPKTFPVQSGLQRGQFEAASALWNLAFAESNLNLIKSENGAAKLQGALAKTTDPSTKKAIEGVLFMLPAPLANPPTSKPPAKGHVMLSYNWAVQSTVKRIAKSLVAHGYKVWLDVEQMKGDTLEAMANAIEGADMILICMSQKYKDSANCKLEGEYCINRKVAYVPLMMQKGYRPDGWLGISLGTRLYYDFTDEEGWEQKIADLINAIGDSGKSK